MEDKLTMGFGRFDKASEPLIVRGASPDGKKPKAVTNAMAVLQHQHSNQEVGVFQTTVHYADHPEPPRTASETISELAKKFDSRRILLGKYKRLMPVAQAYANMSKYPGTKVGCAIFGKRFEPLSSGWNGAARGSKADEDGRLVDRSTRMLWACHSESNAIANAAATGVSLVGSTILVTLHPCMTCAKLIVQSGIIRVICPAPTSEDSRWAEEFEAAKQLFAECGVELITDE